ncbi:MULTISPECIES: GMC family oxidoreductase N-terminal domain-containing protein [unclassified Ensifer]|uniref:GMC family oxidoreductase n=1 Tax=unclassified Ensifer TaxID=2633371 RepID=UPI000813679A|nr:MULTISPECIES: GMC family oxidoreductase N-terminal domain-containing protein [unclassified Ensifer]OCO98403.1 alcohol dehydrogenase [Ensifer sp. LC14]OCP02499.1 alcohol dehydrogenase [Ensifer sp. LC11]OCP02623.1 alcohol dehydrogenase [Ensifer sp. LC13]OCP29846.1 alcohol dehydrogenase [Ensifer sp. LC499]
METFDHIVVGAGSAGCVVANRLSARSSNRVLVIENGGGDRDLRVKVPAGILAMYGRPRFDYGFVGTPQPELDNRRIPVNRGRMLGGSSALNSMLYIRGARQDYDEWRDLGCEGWGWQDVLPVFKDLEHNRVGQDPALHGTRGELYVDRPKDPNPVCQDFIAAGEMLGLPRNSDFNGPSQFGLGVYDLTQNNGIRFSAYNAFLEPVRDRPNLTVWTGTEVRRLILDGARVTGVEVLRDGQPVTVLCRGEIVLSAGAIGTPVILMASGIGPGAALQKEGITVARDLRGVGQNLRDHVDGMITVRSPSTRTLGISWRNAGKLLAAPFRFAVGRKGLLSTNYVVAGGFAKTLYAGELPDVQFHFVPGYRSHRGRLVEWGHGFAIHTCVLRPKSVGEVRISRKGGRLVPEIDHRFFSDFDDARVLVEGIKLARAIFAAPPMAGLEGREILPGPDVRTDEEILAYLRAEALTVYHPVGTARMGRDAMAVIDPVSMKVFGIEGLRVADASVMPTLIAGNTNAPSMMIGEKCARAMLRPAAHAGL